MDIGKNTLPLPVEVGMFSRKFKFTGSILFGIGPVKEGEKNEERKRKNKNNKNNIRSCQKQSENICSYLKFK